MTHDSFNDKFIAYVDILGFKNLVDTAEADVGLSVGDLKEICAALGTPEDRAEIAKYGPTICPESACIRRDLDFQITQASDGVVLSVEISPAGAINLVSHCQKAAMRLLTKGVMVRGYITRGPIYHEGHVFMGGGYQRALDRERGVTAFRTEADERGTPFIEVDPVLREYIRECGDRCVNEMFSRMTEGDQIVAAIFPFKKLSYLFSLARGKDKESVEIVRNSIGRFKEKIRRFADESSPNAEEKARHYIRKLDDQLLACDRMDAMIDRLSVPLPAKRMSDLK